MASTYFTLLFFSFHTKTNKRLAAIHIELLLFHPHYTIMMNNEIILESFSDPVHSWNAMNDPVMGGESYSTVTIQDKLGIFEGEVVDVPFLHAPGFITMRGEGEYPDVSSCDSLRLTARSSEPYSGYRISFGQKTVPGNHHAFGFKADFNPLVSSDMGDIDIPFKDFTVRWNDATGDPIVSCAEDENFCPDVSTLQNMKTISVWGEGVAGKVHLEIESIKAIGCVGEGVSRVTVTTARSSDSEGGPALVSPVLFIGVALAAFFGSFFGGLFIFRRQQHVEVHYSNLSNSGVV